MNHRRVGANLRSCQAWRSHRSMAVEVGFEPTEGLPLHTLSRRAPSATRRLHRRRAYLSEQAFRLSALGEECLQERGAVGREDAAHHLDGLTEPRIVQHVPD